jgi:GTP-binding protein HflX
VSENPINRILLAIRKFPNERPEKLQSRVEELIGLCEAAGGTVLEHFIQERPAPDRALYLGSGKVQEIAETVRAQEADMVICDGELSPGQIRNLENHFSCRVLDRTQLILDIFALRARSREGILQVEIAQLQYLLPRLTGRGVEMSRLGGGIGTRGPGETKLETDRRRIRQRVDHLRAQLRQVRQVRHVQRTQRSKSVPVVALVGYTNAGKTTLMQRWTSDRGFGQASVGNSRLFDTLDPLARRVKAPASGEMVILDTVGFVQNLPHLLVDAFRATLEEVMSADLIVHVVDATDDPSVRIETTYQVLGEIGALDKPVLTFFNKMDLTNVQPGPDTKAVVSVYGSAQTALHMDRLYTEVERLLEVDVVHYTLSGRVESAAFWKDLAGFGQVTSSAQASDADAEWDVTIALPRRLASRFLQFVEKTYSDLRVDNVFPSVLNEEREPAPRV